MKKRFRRRITPLFFLPVLLLASCQRLPPAAEPAPSLSPAPSETAAPAPSYEVVGGYSVKTDYSKLTPYVPPEEKYTRLSDTFLTALAPSDGYGLLLPYIGESLYGGGGYNMSSLYGLVTADGMIVTDPVYIGVWQGYYYEYGSLTGKYMPAYNLQMLDDAVDQSRPWDSVRHAACALDGSWITPFDYSDIYFTDTVILLVRDYETNDVDVMDYGGKLLYNSKSLSCFERIPPQSSYMFQSCYGEGLIALTLEGGSTVYVDAATGGEQYTDFEQGGAFSGGLSAVKQDGLFGYVDKSLSLVIPPQYVSAEYFYNGKSTVQLADGSFAVIDRGGTALLTSANYITRWNGTTYGVFDGNQTTRYYGADLKEVKRDGYHIEPLSDGWFSYQTEDGLVIFNERESKDVALPGVKSVGYIRDGLVGTYIDGPAWQEGLVTLDGKTLIPPADNQSIILAGSEVTGKTYVIAAFYGDSPAFKVYDGEGGFLFEGSGYAGFLPQHDLFEIRGDDGYGYADLSGSYIFRISLLKYVPD